MFLVAFLCRFVFFILACLVISCSTFLISHLACSMQEYSKVQVGMAPPGNTDGFQEDVMNFCLK